MSEARRKKLYFNPLCKNCAFHCQYTKEDMDEGVAMKDPKKDCPYHGKKSFVANRKS